MGPNGSRVQLCKPTPTACDWRERGPADLDADADVGAASEIPFVTDVSCDITLHGHNVGVIQACVLQREAMVPKFHQSLQSTSQELVDCGRLLFDHRGRLRPTYAVAGSVRAGSGAWGHELSSGSLAFVLGITVRPAYRSQGIEHAALDLLIAALAQPERDRSYDGTWSAPAALFYLPINILDSRTDSLHGDRPLWANACRNGSKGMETVLPCCLSGLAKERLSAQRRLPKLLTEYGFRRVGTSPYLAFSLDPQHPSHRIRKDLDAPHPVPPVGGSLNPQKEFPLHFHILALPPPTCSPSSGPELFHLISYIRTAPLAYIQRADHLGCTPLHLAASTFNLPLLKALLARSRAELAAKMYDGLTPLDLLKQEMTSAEDHRRLMGVAEEDVGDAHEEACLAWFLAAERAR